MSDRMALVASGHMIDAADRPKPRFPADREAAAAAWYRQQVSEATAQRGVVAGFSSCANGADILFLEACREFGIDTTIVLPFVPKRFIETSVAAAGAGWERRFHDLWDHTPKSRREVMGLPVVSSSYTTCNARILELARRAGAIRVLALWNGEEGDGEGGTAHLVAHAKDLGAEVRSADPLKLPAE